MAHHGIPRRARVARPSGAPAHVSQKFPVLRRTRQSLQRAFPQLPQ
jgi:hypothetical protein